MSDNILGGVATAKPVRRRRSGNWIGFILPLAILSGWQAASHYQWVPPVFLPSPGRTLASFWDLLTKQSFEQDFFISITLVSQSFLLGALAALLLGIAAGMSRKVENFFGPTFDTIRHIPGIAWLPLIILWLGVGAPAKTLVIAKSVFFPVFLNTLQGIRNVDRNYIELGEVLRLTRWQTLRRIVIPAALPNVMVSLRYSAGLAWALVVVAEGIAGQVGIGFLIFRAQSLLLTDQLLVCMATIGIVGFLIDRLMLALQKRALVWKQGYEG
ncbi:ABC transporter permease [Brenneria nigrifluens]|uniref:ABC transporter permease n=2 Tax=Brenneria nigrifluens DSM 30175 = ATCC 13028 TaxID=1121120 RepID=A0ABX5V1A1_9GAMM|nr:MULTISPECIES: ABC transporter permease [Brenneria]EHD20901.1 ABC-type transporter, integral membrane subunit [Brenneria sp. EniD312]QCR04065.1 ABC transporter permease [Brenneria nigrifluens] [Brenneria nigrifluens DSM 30175 = ATCC 13028]